MGLCSNVCDEVGLIRESRHQVANKRIDRQTDRETDGILGWGGWLETRVYVTKVGPCTGAVSGKQAGRQTDLWGDIGVSIQINRHTETGIDTNVHR